MVVTIHVSTAYCNCDRNVVEEVIYPPSIGPNQIISVVEALDENLVDTLTPKLVGNRPNTYTFTKALAECWLKDNKGDLPLVIVRPSIVLSSCNEPLKGWLDNWNGPTGIIAATGKGLFRTMLCQPDNKADLIPVDMVINLMIAAAWNIGTHKTKEIPIYNCCTGQRQPITWFRFVDLCLVYLRKYPFSEIAWYPDGTITSSAVKNNISRLLLQWLPAYILDAAVWLFGGKPIMVKIQDKLYKAALCLEYFTTKEWEFDDSNVQTLNSLLSEEDRKEFCFDVAQIKWEEYIKDYVLGIRRFIFKEEITSLPTARNQVSRFYWIQSILQVVSVMTLWYFLTLRFAPLKQLWSNALRLLVHIVRMILFVK